MWRTTVRSLVLASSEGFCHTADRPGVSPQGHRRNPRGHAVQGSHRGHTLTLGVGLEGIT